MDIKSLNISKLHAGFVNKEFSATEITKAYLDEIAKSNSEINAFLDIYHDQSLDQAKAADAKINANEAEQLTGIPIAIKDNILIKNFRATAASKMLENYIASYDAYVIKKLKSQKAIFLGKTNLDEFAMGSSTENSAFGTTKNPHDLERVSGGSSGGSAAAVSANMTPAALGSDTGGSIRQPASFCGVVGLKPTYGAVSRSGLIALSSSLDQIGPITKTVKDASVLFNAIKGKDPYDNTSANSPNESTLELDFSKLKSMTIGIPEEYFNQSLQPEVQKTIEEVIKTYQSLGIKFKSVSLPHTKYALSCYYIIMPAEASSNLARFDSIRFANVSGVNREQENLSDLYKKSKTIGFGPEPKRRIILGTFVLSSGYYDAYYKKAQQVRNYFKDDFTFAFSQVNAILAPVSPTTAFKIGERTNDPMSMYLSDILTIPANLAGLPAISIPSKNPIGSLPINFQLIGPKWHDQEILNLGQLYQES